MAFTVGAFITAASFITSATITTPAVPGHPAVVPAAGLRAVAAYWTPGRMRRATPAPGSPAAGRASAWRTGNTAGSGLRWVHGGAVTRSTGKVFFTLGGTDYVCSGSAVDSAHADVVLTAAHCVSAGVGQWAVNWLFVPGYRDGAEPYGAYAARRFFVSPRWSGTLGDGAAADERYDIAFVTVGRATPYRTRARGPRAGSLPATAPVAFGWRGGLATAYVFGYPSLPPYTGLYSNYCAGPAQAPVTPGTSGAARTTCTMTAGDSGGPWFAGFSPQAGTGTIVAISTFKFSGETSTLYGTVLGPAARLLYLAASLSPDR